MNHSHLLPVENNAVVLRPAGIGRYGEAVFLGIWLTFWSIFEMFVVAVLGSLLLALFGFLRDSRLTSLGRAAIERAPGFEVGVLFVYLFLIVWMALWTIGGVAAGYDFLRLVGGSDRLAVVGDELHVSWRAGPVRRSRRFGRGGLRRVRVRSHDKAWLVRPGQLDYRLGFGPLVKQRTFRDADLHIDCSLDSDGDATYKLRVANATTKRTIASAMNDDTELSDTARWLESVTGVSGREAGGGESGVERLWWGGRLRRHT